MLGEGGGISVLKTSIFNYIMEHDHIGFPIAFVKELDNLVSLALSLILVALLFLCPLLPLISSVKYIEDSRGILNWVFGTGVAC